LIVTVSRQRGSRGSYLARRLAERLDYQLLHREVIDEICNSSGYRRQVIESLDDKTRSNIELWFEGLIKRQYVDASGYFKHLLKVIRSFAEYSGVVVVGRGANFILGARQGYHIRVIAEHDTRRHNLVKYQGLSEKKAEQDIRSSDRERADFIRSNFNRDIDDPAAYDLVINSTHTEIDRALEMVQLGVYAKTDFINSGS
jgi:cytidylate kinase